MSSVKTFHANKAGRDFVVSDIHGCTDEFHTLLSAVDFNPRADRVFSVGDLVDRGPDSMGALRLLNEPWFHAVMGNHEAMMLDALRGDDPHAMAQWVINGGIWHGDHLGDEIDGLLSRLLDLPLAIIVGDGSARFNVVHAEFFGSDDDLALGEFSDQQTHSMLWGRDLSCNPSLAHRTPGSTTYVGHTIVGEPVQVGSHRFIDTGAFLPYWADRPGRMTLVDALSGAMVHAGYELECAR